MSSEKPKFLVFLDFNGVVMHKGARRFERSCVQRVNGLIESLDARIVISSSKRVLSSIRKLNTLFNGKIIGATPDLDYSFYGSEYIRYKEVLEFLAERGWENTRWIAIDDRRDHFPKSASVFFTDSDVLITDEDVEEIVSRYSTGGKSGVKFELISKPTETNQQSEPLLEENGRATDPIFLFLDFDGVLRRLTSDPSRFDSDCLEKFESAVRPLPNVKVVISSTWRLAMSLTVLRRLFSADVAERIVGVTPELSAHSTHARYIEIRAYLKAQSTGSKNWVAIDDDPEHFPTTAPVLLTDPDVGFNAECAIRLWEYVAKHYQQ